MTTFPSGTAYLAFEAKWCARCVHQESENGTGCPVISAHLCPPATDSAAVLRMLIPEDASTCRMFHEESPLTDADRKYLNWAREKERTT